MTRWTIALSMAAVLSACAGSPPQTTAASQPATSTQANQVTSSTNAKGQEKSQEKMICTEGMAMGSHIPQRVCISAEEAKKRQEADKRALRNLQSNTGPNSCKPSC